MASAVSVQMTMVSAKTSKMPNRPCRSGSAPCAPAWAMGAEPMPASWENMPRSIPHCSARWIPIPAAPPSAAVGVKAEATMSTRARPAAGRFKSTTASAASAYRALINGTSRSVTRPMRAAPPISAIPAANAAKMPTVSRRGCSMPVVAGKSAVTAKLTASAAVLACTILPMPNAASAPSSANAAASGLKPRPRARI